MTDVNLKGKRNAFKPLSKLKDKDEKKLEERLHRDPIMEAWEKSPGGHKLNEFYDRKLPMSKALPLLEDNSTLRVYSAIKSIEEMIKDTYKESIKHDMFTFSMDNKLYNGISTCHQLASDKDTRKRQLDNFRIEFTTRSDLTYEEGLKVVIRPTDAKCYNINWDYAPGVMKKGGVGVGVFGGCVYGLKAIPFYAALCVDTIGMGIASLGLAAFMAGHYTYKTHKKNKDRKALAIEINPIKEDYNEIEKERYWTLTKKLQIIQP